MTVYVADDAVSHNGSSYVCRVGHTSGPSNEPGVGASWTTYWMLLAQKGDTGTAGATGATGPANPSIMQLKIFADSGSGSDVVTGDGKLIFVIPEELNGLVLEEAHGYITTLSSSGVVTVQIRNVTDAVDMLTDRITIDVGEYTSYTAVTPSTVNTANDDVVTGDRIAIDIDVAGTGAKGLGIVLRFAPPPP